LQNKMESEDKKAQVELTKAVLGKGKAK